MPLKGLRTRRRKRKAIGERFIRVFEREAKKQGAKCLLQGTIYPDRIESEGGIKSHHNVGGMPLHMEFTKVIEPIRDLYKDEVREVAGALGLPKGDPAPDAVPGPRACRESAWRGDQREGCGHPRGQLDR